MARTTPRIWTDADYAARGDGRISLRLPLEILMKLRYLAASENLNKTEIIETLITQEHRKIFNGK